MNWTTATETNNQGFEIERKSNGGVYEKIGYVAGFGTTTEPKSYSFTDSKVNTGAYSYRLKQIDYDGTFTYSDEVRVNVTAPLSFELSQNYPNPFNPVTTIKYSIPQSADVKLSVYNLLGEQVALLVDEFKEVGVHTINFTANNLQSGFYIYKLESNGFVQSKKMILIK